MNLNMSTVELMSLPVKTLVRNLEPFTCVGDNDSIIGGTEIYLIEAISANLNFSTDYHLEDYPGQELPRNPSISDFNFNISYLQSRRPTHRWLANK